MIRVLFIILAVVSMVLAFVLSISWLYLVAAGMLVTAAVILTLDTRSRLRRSAVAGSRPNPDPVSKAPEDLKSLGIMEIRPKGTTGSGDSGSASRTSHQAPASRGQTAGESASEPGLRAVHEPAAMAGETGAGRTQGTAGENSPPDGASPGTRVEQAETASPEIPPGETISAVRALAPRTPTGNPPSNPPAYDPSRVGVVRKRARTARIMVEGVSESLNGEVVLSTLRALRAAVDATTVTLLRQVEGPLGYSVDAIVSRNSFARSGGQFTVGAPLVASSGTLIPLVLKCMGPDGFNARRLGYYHEPIAIHKVAFVPLTNHGKTYLLVADSMLDEAFDEPDAVRMLKEFGRLMQALVAEPLQQQSSGDGVGALRPRREIIAEEMSAARDAGRPLALALVHLNRGDGLKSSDLSATEIALESRLASSTDGGRVERFGELIFGVLQSRTVDQVAGWASDLHAGLGKEGGVLAGPVSIGVAMLDERHDSPDALRADATAALRESYETGECIILE